VETWLLPEATESARRANRDPGAVAYVSQLHSILSSQGAYRNALEIGGAWGISTLAILDASRGCHLTTVDIDPGIAAADEVEANGLRDRWTFYVGDSKRFWQENSTTFDLVYVDGDHSAEGARIDLFNGWRFLEPGGLLVVDDITHPAHLDAREGREGYLYGVALAAWQLITDVGAAEVGGTPRIAWIRKPRR
jgi:predicted O-methyltransferase YrrM